MERALGGAGGDNEVQVVWWGMLADDETVGLGQLIDYYLALNGKQGGDYKLACSRANSSASDCCRTQRLQQSEAAGRPQAAGEQPRSGGAPPDADAEGSAHHQAGR